MNSLEWLNSGSKNVVKVVFAVHHAPAYLTSIHTGNILDYEHPRDTPSVSDDNITIRSLNQDEAREIIDKAKNTKRTRLSKSPYKKKSPKNAIIPQHRAIKYERDDSELPIQYMISLRNNEVAVYTENRDGYIFPLKSKVKEKINDPTESTRSIPISSTPISDRYPIETCSAHRSATHD